MIFSGARRFGLLLTRARTGWWRWLIAAFVALLVSVPVAAAAPSERALTVRGPLARTAQAQKLALFIVTKLAEGAVTKAGSEGFGWVLDQFGLGDGLESEIAGIRDQLGEIQNRLTALQTAVTELRGEVAESEYSDLVGQTTPLTSNIDHGMKLLNDVAQWTPSDGTAEQKANFTRVTMKWIGDNLMGGEQDQLAKRISGELGADGLIKAFSKALKFRSACCWTALTSEDVRQVFDYYQLEEARLLTVRVEYMHTHRETYSEAIIKKDVDEVKQGLGTQEKDLIKPFSPCCTVQDPELQKGINDSASVLIADPRTNLIWNTAYLGVKIESWQAPYFDKAIRDHGGWRLASVGEVQQFIHGWQESGQPNWELWLYHLPQVGVKAALFFGGFNRGAARIPSLMTFIPTMIFGGTYPSAASSGYSGVWTQRCSGCAQPTAVSASGTEESPPPGGDGLKGLLLVKERTENYWR